MRLLEKEGEKVPLLGNEAIARGAIEAGVGLVASYPGTPSSEVPMALCRLSDKLDYYFEYSSNEKVSFETAAGAAWSGVRSIVAMKHFGLNVAADSVSPVAYSGVKAGMVMVVADDPQGWSSAQSEQDTRFFGEMFRIPIIEPSSPQEALELTKKAFELSEEFEIPFMLRTTTKVSHSIETVELGEMKEIKNRGEFEGEPERFDNIGPGLQKQHKRINRKLKAIGEKYGEELNRVEDSENGENQDIGIITSGVSYEYVKEAMQKLDIDAPVAKLVITHPISRKFIEKFIKDKKEVLVVEELQPFIEKEVERIAKEANPGIKIHGKNMLPRVGEYNLEVLIPVMEKVFNKDIGIDFEEHDKKTKEAMKDLPPRKPVFCPGCPHRSTFYALKEVYGKDIVYGGDVGCYSLGTFQPYEMQDFLISMGSGLGLTHGIKKVSDQDVVVTVGDSTFFHGGMPGLANLGYNDGESPLVVVFDNRWTAMTGHQPHPGTGETGAGEKVTPLKIEDIAEAMGAEVEVANAFSQKELVEKIKELKKKKGLRVLVSKGECRLVTKRTKRKKGIPLVKFKVDQDKCTKCGICTEKFSCPAIKEERKKKGDEPKYTIDPEICLGCSVCSQVCPQDAIKPRKQGEKE